MRNRNLRKRQHLLTWRAYRKARTSCAFLLAFCLISYGFLPILVAGQIKVSGSIHPNAIQIDNSANVRDNDGNAGIKNPGATLDWVKDFDDNDDPPSLIDSIATGLIFSPIPQPSPSPAIPQTAAPGGVGHWNGVRIVDGFGGGDRDIFTKGGKVNEPLSWEIAPGSIGSAKYDSTQMYIANNQTDIFFGMERNGNNGTTAFDWEFNQKPPLVFEDDPNTSFIETKLNGYVPDRSDGDVMITFEMQGSGNASGSVQTFIFKFDGDDPDLPNDPAPNVYVLCPAVTNDADHPCYGVNTSSVLASINGIEPTPAEPWGYVNGGSWVLTPGFPLRFFAEAKVSLSLLPGINTCGGSGFVAVRTRASATLTSDAKDTTKIFEYSFGGPTARGELRSGCGLKIEYDGTASTNATNGTTGLSYSFQFQRYTGPLSDGPNNYDENKWVNYGDAIVDEDGIGEITVQDAGAYRAKLTITQVTGCTDDVTTNVVVVFPNVDGTAALVGDCDDTFYYTATGSGGSGGYRFDWKIYKVGEANSVHEFSVSTLDVDDPNTAINETITRDGTLDIDSFRNGQGGGDGGYYAVVTIFDKNNVACNKEKTTDTIQVRHPLTVSIAKNLVTTNSNMVDGSFSVQLLGTIGNAGADSISKQWKQFTTDPAATTDVGTNSDTLTRTMAEIISAGTTDVTEQTATILNDVYKLRRSSLNVKLTVSRSLNGQECPVTSAPATIKALKGIDP